MCSSTARRPRASGCAHSINDVQHPANHHSAFCNISQRLDTAPVEPTLVASMPSPAADTAPPAPGAHAVIAPPDLISPRRIFITAAEVSGDRHAAQFIRSLRELHPEIVVEGLGGPEMAAAG